MKRSSKQDIDASAETLGAEIERQPNPAADASVLANVAKEAREHPSLPPETIAQIALDHEREGRRGNPVWRIGKDQKRGGSWTITDGRKTITAVNPADDMYEPMVLWFGQTGTTYLAVWASNLDDAVEVAAEWLAMHAPGHIAVPESDDSEEEGLYHTESGYLEGHEFGVDVQRGDMPADMKLALNMLHHRAYEEEHGESSPRKALTAGTAGRRGNPARADRAEDVCVCGHPFGLHDNEMGEVASSEAPCTKCDCEGARHAGRHHAHVPVEGMVLVTTYDPSGKDIVGTKEVEGGPLQHGSDEDFLIRLARETPHGHVLGVDDGHLYKRHVRVVRHGGKIGYEPMSERSAPEGYVRDPGSDEWDTHVAAFQEFGKAQRAFEAGKKIRKGETMAAFAKRRDAVKAKLAKARAAFDAATATGRVGNPVEGEGTDLNAKYGEFNTRLAKLLQKLKKDAGATIISQNYKGTGGRAYRRQLWVSFKSGAVIDLWLEAGRIEFGGVVKNGPPGSNVALPVRHVSYGDGTPEQVYAEAMPILNAWANPAFPRAGNPRGVSGGFVVVNTKTGKAVSETFRTRDAARAEAARIQVQSGGTKHADGRVSGGTATVGVAKAGEARTGNPADSAMHLVYLKPNQAWVFLWHDRPTRMGDEDMFFQKREVAVAAAKRQGLTVDKAGHVTSRRGNPLKPGSTPEIVSENIAEGMHAGVPQKQAVARALSNARRHPTKGHPLKPLTVMTAELRARLTDWQAKAGPVHALAKSKTKPTVGEIKAALAELRKIKPSKPADKKHLATTVKELVALGKNVAKKKG